MSGINPGAFGATAVSFTQNTFFDLINGPVWSGSWTAGTTNTAFGSTMHMQRLLIPGPMVMTEVDLVHQLSFASSSLSGACSMSQSFGVFSFVNATSLASVFSASSTWAWVSGSASANLTGVQNGWNGILMHSMGLTSGSAGTNRITGGEYVFAHIINVSASAVNGSAGGSNMSMSLYGVNMVTGLTSATVTGISNAGTAQIDVLSNSGTAQVVVLSNAGTAVKSLPVAGVTSTSFTSTSQITALNTLTVFTAAPTVASRTVFSAAPTNASRTLFTAAPTSIQAVSNVGLTYNPIISVQNTGSSFSSASANWFRAGVMATAAMPANITLSSTNVTMSGSIAFQQPWFAIAGS